MTMITTTNIYSALSCAKHCAMHFIFITSFHLHNKPMRFSRRNYSLQRYMFLLPNKFLPIHQTRAQISLPWGSFPPFSPSPSPPPIHFFFEHYGACFFFFLIDTLGDTVTHQFCLTALSLSVCWVSGCGCNTLKVGGVLNFAPNTGQNVGRVCTYKIWSRTRHLLNCNELDFCPLSSFRFHIMFPRK